jgi:tetratricopeptide (TPR) repeat protein
VSVAYPFSLLKDGKYREALGKWEAALTLTPESAVLHEQKAQVLLEIGDSWNALKAATRETQFLFYFYFYFPDRVLYAFILHDRSIKNDRTVFPYAIFELVFV